MARRETLLRPLVIREATRLFFENGYTQTTASAVCARIGISKGNLTFHFPTKEHMLDILVRMMCDFQWKKMTEATREGTSFLLAYCLELTAMAAICEKSSSMRDFYLSAYTHPMSLDTIRQNDTEKLKTVFGAYCRGWTEARFAETEAIVSGIEYATLMTTPRSADLPTRIERALGAILGLFGVPPEEREAKIRRVLAMDYHAIGSEMLEDFRKYTEGENERAIEEKLALYRFSPS